MCLQTWIEIPCNRRLWDSEDNKISECPDYALRTDELDEDWPYTDVRKRKKGSLELCPFSPAPNVPCGKVTLGTERGDLSNLSEKEWCEDCLDDPSGIKAIADLVIEQLKLDWYAEDQQNKGNLKYMNRGQTREHTRFCRGWKKERQARLAMRLIGHGFTQEAENLLDELQDDQGRPDHFLRAEYINETVSEIKQEENKASEAEQEAVRDRQDQGKFDSGSESCGSQIQVQESRDVSRGRLLSRDGSKSRYGSKGSCNPDSSSPSPLDKITLQMLQASLRAGGLPPELFEKMPDRST